MSASLEGFTLRRAFLRQQFIPWDEVRALDGAGLTLREGNRVTVPAAVLGDARRALEGPPRQGTLEADGAALMAYLQGPWAPERTVTWLLETAAHLGASDVHFEPGATAVDVRLRIAGELVRFATLPGPVAQRLTAALKAASQCLPYRRDLVQEGRITRAGVTADVRASFIPTAMGERVALRLFGRLLTLDALGLPAAVQGPLTRALTAPSGLLLVAGPSGGGKTTTLYAALQQLSTQRQGAHLSLEDPVEQRLRVAGVPVDQVELSPERGLTGEAALVAALRQDVDVLCVSEVRTGAEAQLAVKAAHTGRLVLAGLHAGSTREALQRLEDLGVEPSLITQTVVGVLHQRLVSRPCPSHTGASCSACRGAGRVRVVEASFAEGGR